MTPLCLRTKTRKLRGKKTAYYLLSDGMPLLSGRLPVSDAFLSKEDEEKLGEVGLKSRGRFV